ncbi:MAG: alpha/beta fold hydrolase [Longimicrobiales bacterium]
MNPGLMACATTGTLATSMLGACAGRAGPDSAHAVHTSACGQRDTGRTAAGLYFECSGAGARVIILLHAFSMDRRMWEPQVAALQRAARVIVYDLRAHGRSAPALEPYSAADDLLGLMDELGVSSAHLVGLSNGARVALDFVLTHPARVRSVVLAAPGVSGYVNRDPMPWMQPVIDAARSGDVLKAADLWAATPLLHIAHDSLAAARILTISRDNRALWGYRTNPERMLEPPAWGRLAEVRVPVLVLTGENDVPELRRLADTLAQRIPGAQLQVIPRAGHMLNLAAPEEFNAAMRRFLNR